jgi:hypothetical protein
MLRRRCVRESKPLPAGVVRVDRGDGRDRSPGRVRRRGGWRSSRPAWPRSRRRDRRCRHGRHPAGVDGPVAWRSPRRALGFTIATGSQLAGIGVRSRSLRRTVRPIFPPDIVSMLSVAATAVVATRARSAAAGPCRLDPIPPSCPSRLADRGAHRDRAVHGTGRDPADPGIAGAAAMTARLPGPPTSARDFGPPPDERPAMGAAPCRTVERRCDIATRHVIRTRRLRRVVRAGVFSSRLGIVVGP